MEATIKMTDRDARRLAHTMMAWGPSWKDQVEEGRFEPSFSDTGPSLHWQTAFWLGDNEAALVLFTSFLTAVGHEHEVVRDSAEGFEGYVVLTTWTPA